MSKQIKEKNTKMKRILKYCLGLCSLLFVGAPIIFALVFHGSDGSRFLCLFKTDVSVSDWFSFWTSYLTLLQSFLLSLPGVILSVVALKLSWQIEHERLYEVGLQNKTLFVIQDINVEVYDAKCKLVIGLHPDIVKLKNLHVLQATLNIENHKNQKVQIPFTEDSTKGNILASFCNGSHMAIHLSQNNEAYAKTLEFWKYQNHHMSCYNKDATLRIEYSYEVLKSATHYEGAFGKIVLGFLGRFLKTNSNAPPYRVSSVSVLSIGALFNVEKIMCDTEITVDED